MSAIPELVRRGARHAIRAAARDLTAESAGRSALVLAPHPDDETLGCGVTILRKVSAGTPVTVLVLTDGAGSHHSRHLPATELAAMRRAEMAEAARRLGLAEGALRWAGLPDGAVAEHEDALVAILVALLAELGPREVYTTGADEPHPDHAAAGRAARRAVRAAGSAGAGPPAGSTGPAEVLEYPIWLWGSWPLSRTAPLASLRAAAGLVGRRAARTVRTDGFLAAKRHALQAHRSQLARPDGVPATEEWATLPPAVLRDAHGPVELFLPVAPG